MLILVHNHFTASICYPRGAWHDCEGLCLLLAKYMFTVVARMTFEVANKQHLFTNVITANMKHMKLYRLMAMLLCKIQQTDLSNLEIAKPWDT